MKAPLEATATGVVNSCLMRLAMPTQLDCSAFVIVGGWVSPWSWPGLGLGFGLGLGLGFGFGCPMFCCSLLFVIFTSIGVYAAFRS